MFQTVPQALLNEDHLPFLLGLNVMNTLASIPTIKKHTLYRGYSSKKLKIDPVI
jgi:hypothetical protein